MRRQTGVLGLKVGWWGEGNIPSLVNKIERRYIKVKGMRAWLVIYERQRERDTETWRAIKSG